MNQPLRRLCTEDKVKYYNKSFENKDFFNMQLIIKVAQFRLIIAPFYFVSVDLEQPTYIYDVQCQRGQTEMHI